MSPLAPLGRALASAECRLQLLLLDQAPTLKSLSSSRTLP
jgi:hypothetical protein